MSYNGKVWGEPIAKLPESAYRKLPESAYRKPKSGLPQWRPMTGPERKMAAALGCCTFPPGTSQKRFARTISAQAAQPEPKITDRQRDYLHKMVHRYRRQIPTEILMLRLDDAEANQ